MSDAQALVLRHADRDLAPCDVSAMNGYAARSADLAQPQHA